MYIYYNKGSKSLPDFLEGIAHNIHFNMKFNPRDQELHKAGGREWPGVNKVNLINVIF